MPTIFAKAGRSAVVSFFRITAFAIIVCAAPGLLLPSLEAQTNCVTSPSGLVSWWKAEGNGVDSTGTNNAVLAGVGFANGEVGQADNFTNISGTPVKMSASTTLDVGTGNGLTLEAWINPKDVSTGHPIVEWNSGSFGVCLWVANWGQDSTPGSLYADVKDNGLNDHAFQSAGGLLVTNSFQHVALTYDKTSGLASLYINGLVVNQKNVGTFTPFTSSDMYVGYRPFDGGAGSRFFGQIDELSLYGRALGSNEIAAIYSAGSSGKCSGPVPPFIISQPQNVTVTAGNSATFSVTANGTAPLNYQWRFNGTNISGATTSSFSIPVTRTTNAGLYSVLVSNSVNSVLSSNAVLTVNPLPSQLQIGSANAASGASVTIPIFLVASGSENALSYSINFNASRLVYSSTILANGAGATLFVNESGSSTGRLGMVIGVPAGSTFPPGTQELAEVTFTAAIVTNNTTTPVTFVDQPIVRQVSDAAGHILTANYANGAVSITAGDFEADVAPRPGGDKAVTVIDWVQIGLYAAKLASPTNSSEFQRADCSPRATLGDGKITVADWVQAGRYAAGLDPLTLVGGPTSPAASPSIAIKSSTPKSQIPRHLQAADTVLAQGQSGPVSINLQALGNENALGFSLSFDANSLSYSSASLGSAAGQATLNVNSAQANSGILGFVLALPSGANFPAGLDEVVKVTFQANTSATGSVSVTFSDLPVDREADDPGANVLAMDYLDATVTINPLPALRISQTGQNITLAWPLWATNFVLQQATGPFGASTNWSGVTATIGATTNENSVSVPIDSGTKFYRLYKP